MHTITFNMRALYPTNRIFDIFPILCLDFECVDLTNLFYILFHSSMKILWNILIYFKIMRNLRVRNRTRKNTNKQKNIIKWNYFHLSKLDYMKRNELMKLKTDKIINKLFLLRIISHLLWWTTCCWRWCLI